MKTVTLYHNPACSKSRAALEILSGRDVALEVVEYLQEPLSTQQILRLIEMLEVLESSASGLVRDDSHFKELGLNMADYSTAEAVAQLLAQHPRLMQRPVVVQGDRAVIARPPELLEQLL